MQYLMSKFSHWVSKSSVFVSKNALKNTLCMVSKHSFDQQTFCIIWQTLSSGHQMLSIGQQVQHLVSTCFCLASKHSFGQQMLLIYQQTQHLTSKESRLVSKISVIYVSSLVFSENAAYGEQTPSFDQLMLKNKLSYGQQN